MNSDRRKMLEELTSKMKKPSIGYQLTEEEKVWARLSGKTEERFRMELLIDRIVINGGLGSNNPPKPTKEV